MDAGKKEVTHDKEWERKTVQRIRNGNEGAFSELIHRYQKRMFLIAYRFTQNSEDAMELVQESFIRLYEKIDQWREEISLSGWVFRITQNLCIDHYRRHTKKSRQISAMEEIREIDARPLWNSGHAQARELLPLVDRSIHTLSPKQQLVFTLKHHQGKKFQEIAEITGVSLGTVKTLHHRAIQKIRKILHSAEKEGGK